MTLPTVNDVQLVEPILTNLLVSYMQSDNRFVASRVFPYVPVDKDSGTFYTIPKAAFFRDEMEERAPGGEFANIDYSVSSDTYKTLQYAVAAEIPDEVRVNSQMPLSQETLKMRLFAQRSLIRKERAFAADFMVNSVWGTTDNNSTTDWDDTVSGDPVLDIETARRTISNNTGMDPNTMVLGYIVHQAIKTHPDILDRLKYTTAATGSAVEAALAAIFEVDNYWVAKATYSATNESATFSATAIIDDDCLVCHVDPSAVLLSGTEAAATSGKTFTWAGGGGAGSVYTHYDPKIHATVLQHKEQWDQKAIATDLGYLFLDVV